MNESNNYYFIFIAPSVKVTQVSEFFFSVLSNLTWNNSYVYNRLVVLKYHICNTRLESMTFEACGACLKFLVITTVRKVSSSVLSALGSERGTFIMRATRVTKIILSVAWITKNSVCNMCGWPISISCNCSTRLRLPLLTSHSMEIGDFHTCNAIYYFLSVYLSIWARNYN